jgi:hypothetical protein
VAQGFAATIERSYLLDGKCVLVLDRYEGDVDRDDWLEVELPSGAFSRVRVVAVAWGSAFHALDAPLSLTVVGLAGGKPASGASIRGVDSTPPDRR